MSNPRLCIVDTDAGLRLAATERAARIDALTPNRSHLLAAPPSRWSPDAADAEQRLRPKREEATLAERIEAWRFFAGVEVAP
jgi:hypothetical protein